MKKRAYIISIILAAIVSFTVVGKTPVMKRSFHNSLESASLGIEKAETHSAGAFLYSPIKPLTVTSIGVFHRNESRPVFIQKGDKEIVGIVKIDSRIRLNENKALQGGVTYQNGIKYNIRWNSTSDLDLLYPYILADETGGNLNSEMYTFFGKYTGQTNQAHYGIGCRYRALHEFRTVDPRPRNITSDFSISGTIGAVFTQYVTDINLSYRKYNQRQDMVFQNPLGANATERHFTGLGSHIGRFAGTGTYADTQYDGHGAEVSFMLLPKREKCLRIGVVYNIFNVTRMLISQNSAPITDLLLQEASGFVSYAKHLKSTTLGVSVNTGYKLRQGTENVIDNGKSGYFKSLVSLTMYTNKKLFADIKGLIEIHKQYGVWSLAPYLNFNSEYAIYKYPERVMLISGIGTGIDLEFIGKTDKWIYRVGTCLGYDFHPMNKFDIPQEHTEKGIFEFYYRQFKNSSADFFNGTFIFSLQREIKNNFAFFLKSSVKGIYFANREKAVCLQLSTGLIF